MQEATNATSEPKKSAKQPTPTKQEAITMAFKSSIKDKVPAEAETALKEKFPDAKEIVVTSLGSRQVVAEVDGVPRKVNFKE